MRLGIERNSYQPAIAFGCVEAGATGLIRMSIVAKIQYSIGVSNPDARGCARAERRYPGRFGTIDKA